MKKCVSRIGCVIICSAMIVSSFLLVPSCTLPEQTEIPEQSVIQGENNKFIDSGEVGKVSKKLIPSQTGNTNESIAVEVDPFMEETFLLQVDQNENIESVRKVAEGDGKAIYAVTVVDDVKGDDPEPVITEAPTDVPENQNNTSNPSLVETVKEQIDNMTGVNEVKDTGEIAIPVSEMEKTFTGQKTDADGNLLVPFDVIYPEILEDESTLFETEHILLKMPKDFSGNVTRELTFCGVSSFVKFMETETGDWFRAELYPGIDTVTAVKKARSLTSVIVSDFDYIYETTDTEIEEGGEEPEEPSDPMTDNPLASQQWYLTRCGIPDAWAFLEEHGIPAGGASNVIVAVIDTGVDYNHPDLKANMWINLGEIPDNGIDDDGNGYVDDIHGVDVIANTGNPMDDNGHGTHVAGIIGASNNKEGILGVAYNTKIMAVKAGQASGVFNQSDIAEAILYAAANGAGVINMSFGGKTTSLVVQDALATAYTKSVLVAAAGNDGSPNEGWRAVPRYPAVYSYVVGVMSVDQYNVESSFSNWDSIAFNSKEYEVYAPGERILSTFPDERYISLNGTSMAAPIVSGIAALLRSFYTDLDMYPSRFIAAQLCATSEIIPACFNPAFHGLHNIPMAVNAYDGLTVFPKPDVHLYDFYITDNNDGCVDSGDTIEIGLVLRNRWGMSKNTVATLETRTIFKDADTGEIIYGPENPYIEVINGIVDLGGVGTYNTKSMMIYDNTGVITGVDSPFVIKVSNDCPNDYTILLTYFITYENGLDEDDSSTYNNGAFGETIEFSVRKGVVKKGRISENEVWTKNNYYIISGPLYIEENVLLTIEEGTTVQVNSNVTNIIVAGKMRTEGDENNPVVFVPEDISNRSNGIPLVKKDSGSIVLKYTTITNPRVDIDIADHCKFNASLETGYEAGVLRTSVVKNSLIKGLFNSPSTVNLVGLFSCCCFVDCRPSQSLNTYAQGNLGEDRGDEIQFQKCTFYQFGGKGFHSYESYIVYDGSVYQNSAYFQVSAPLNFNSTSALYHYYLLEEFSNTLGGHLACFESEEELNAVRYDGFVGLVRGSEEWINGAAVQDWVDVTVLTSPYAGDISEYYAYPRICYKGSSQLFYQYISLGNGQRKSYLLELPLSDDLTCEYISEKLLEFTSSYSHLKGNAILGGFPMISESNPSNVIDVSGNWWWTQDREAIERNLFGFTVNAERSELNPYPTLELPPEDVWPFVIDVYILDHNGERVYTVGNEEVTFVVEFNRDMDTDYGLRVRFGAAEPYAEYEVPGEFVTPRRWEGTYTLKTTIENGTQYFRIENGRAADDHWLTLYESPARFQFEIDTTAAMAMSMQGEATDTGIELTWLQDDYETLAGYNVYRSTREDGYYSKLNDVVIPVGSEHFFDDTVEPGVVYYYNFTVVLTDMSESTPSGKITIMSKDTMAPNIYHTPVRTAYTGNNLIVSATVTDNLGLHSVKLFYRTFGTDEWLSTEMTPINNKYYATVVADKISTEGLEYYIEAFDGINYTYNGTAETPYFVTVKLAVEASSLGDVDGDGVITGKDALMIVQAINDLLNLTEAQFMRADINGDGELSSAEALRILKYVSGKVTTIVG